MTLVFALLIVAAASGLMILAILRLRRRAPEGSYFVDGDRASGVFGVLSTGFALLLGFVVFLAFTEYDDARAGAEAEALVLVQQFETAQLLPADSRAALSGQLVCYGRSVVGTDWPGGDADGAHINPWSVALFRTLQGIEPETASEQSAYDAWLGQTNAREEARRDRVHGAEGIVPLPVWLVLFLCAALVLAFVLPFADPSEKAWVQAMLAGSVTAVVVAMLLVLAVLSRPYADGLGALRPVAMERTLATLDEAGQALGLGLDQTLPCDGTGAPR